MNGSCGNIQSRGDNKTEALKKQILELLGHRRLRLTPSALGRAMDNKQTASSKILIRRVIKEMVADGDLMYTNHFNTSHLELNFRKPVRVSERIILAPHTCNPSDRIKNELFLRMDQGNAFGVGDHPTTRLCLQAVDLVMGIIAKEGQPRPIRALDIGTGTGVLAMAAAGLGAESVLGIDCDPAALHEAQSNVQLNELSHTVTLSLKPLAAIEKTKFDLVMANLRPATLIDCLPQIERLSALESFWVLSGCRDQEMDRVMELLSVENDRVFWRDRACGWTAIVVHRKNQSEGPIFED